MASTSAKFTATYPTLPSLNRPYLPIYSSEAGTRRFAEGTRRCAEKKSKNPFLSQSAVEMSEKNDSLSAYAGRWVAFVGDDIAGVGHTAESAQQMAQRNRPKERSRPYFVEPATGIRLALPKLMEELRPFLSQHPHAVYLVGGAVRDAVRGEASHDLDFVVASDAIRLTFKVADRLGVPAYVLDQERDIGRVVLADTTLDFARMRGTLADDLQERDFTVNALALPATAQFYESIIDPCGGLDDLKARRLQLTHPQALSADPVRALRAVRQSLESESGHDGRTGNGRNQCCSPIIPVCQRTAA
jgi:hypothetical protein